MRSLDARSVFDNETAIARHLSLLADYVGDIVKEWEDNGEYFWIDHQTRNVGELPRLQAFLGKAADDFRPNAATPMGYVEWIVRGELPEGRGARRRAAEAFGSDDSNGARQTSEPDPATVLGPTPSA